MKTFWYLLTALFTIAAIVGGLYVAIWYCLAGGIIQIVDACKMPVIPSGAIAWGVVRVVMSAPLGWLTFLVGVLLAGFSSAMGDAMGEGRPRKPRHPKRR